MWACSRTPSLARSSSTATATPAPASWAASTSAPPTSPSTRWAAAATGSTRSCAPRARAAAAPPGSGYNPHSELLHAARGPNIGSTRPATRDTVKKWIGWNYTFSQMWRLKPLHTRLNENLPYSIVNSFLWISNFYFLPSCRVLKAIFQKKYFKKFFDFRILIFQFLALESFNRIQFTCLSTIFRGFRVWQ